MRRRKGQREGMGDKPWSPETLALIEISTWSCQGTLNHGRVDRGHTHLFVVLLRAVTYLCGSLFFACLLLERERKGCYKTAIKTEMIMIVKTPGSQVVGPQQQLMKEER